MYKNSNLIIREQSKANQYAGIASNVCMKDYFYVGTEYEIYLLYVLPS